MAQSLSEVQASLATWYAARDAVARNQSYQIGDRSLTRANLREINRTIGHLESRERQLQSAVTGRGRVRYVSS